jgi:hypothetical protein
MFDEKLVGLHFGLHFLQTHLITLLWTRVAGFFLTKYTKTGENIPKLPLNYQLANLYLGNGCNIFQMAIEHTNLFNSKALQNLPKLVFLV